MKRIVSILLAVMLVVSMTVISASAFSAFDEQAEKISDAIAAYEAENEVKVPTYRYYFQIPDGTNGPVKSETDAKGEAGSKAPSWINEYNEGLCSIYYWAKGDFPTPSAWTGYVAEAVEGVDNLFYADVPQNVSTIIWNNGIDGGTDNTNPLYFLRAQTANIKVESLDEGDDDNFPDGLESYDNMIWIVNPDKVSVNSFSGAQTCGGDWYYYYGSGCYGLVAGGEEDVKENCLNPDHDHSADPTEEPTEIVTEEPTAEPTDEPTEIVTEEPTEITTDEPTEEPTAAPVSEKKIYVVGNMTDWTVNEAYEMTLNEEADTTEYSFTMDLTTDSQFKCVVESEGERSWYPDGMGNNYGENGEITANGTYTIYFRPNLDGGDDWFYNCIYVAGEEVVDPTAEPTEEPTEVVTEEPTEIPTTEPSVATEEPTEAPTEEPTADYSDRIVSENISDAIASYEAENGVDVPTYRYYFQIPDGVNGPVKTDSEEKAPSWINEYNKDIAGIYYWSKGDFPKPDKWPGYKADKLEGTDNIFYADVPQGVSVIIWNNGIDGGTSGENNPLFYLRAQTKNISLESLDPGDDDNFPEGLENYDNMIWIVNPDKVSVNSYSGAQTCGGDWYYYYEGGCYGLVANGEKDIKHNCLNPDHDHSADPDPTEAPTEEPTVIPTDEPTEEPTFVPTEPPTEFPTTRPSELPTDKPTEVPTEVPTAVPTDGPTQAPTEPTEAPTQAPTEKPFVLGDADRSGKVEITDATIIQRWLASMITEDRIDLKAADVDGDDKATIRDVTIIQKFLASLCNIDGTPLKPSEPTEPVPTEAPTQDPTPDPTEAPTDAPTDAPTEPAEPKDPIIYFDANSTDLGSYKRIFAHIWKYGGDSFFEWQVKKERCTDQGEGIWAYDLDKQGITLEEGVMYCIIFSTDEGAETYQIFFDQSCYGDTVYCVDEKTENPVDSNKKSFTAYYRNADKTKYGPVLAISSIGNVIGTACAPDTTPYKMFVSFLSDPLGLANAREFTKQTDKEIIDPIAEKLGLSEEEVRQAITESGEEVDY